MGRILAVVLGLGVLAFVVTKSLNRTASDGKPMAPKDRLDNVRQAAKRIEANDQKRAEEMINKAGAAEGLAPTTTE